MVNKNAWLTENVRNTLRRRHYSIHTERSYCDWIRRHIISLGSRIAGIFFQDSESRIEAFLTHLAVDKDQSLGQIA